MLVECDCVTEKRQNRLWGLVVLLCAVPSVIFLFDFLSDVLCLSPVLDARENLAWAYRIHTSSLPEEPLYRALGFPFLLSYVLWAEPYISQLVAISGWLLHVLNAFLVGLLAKSLWSDMRSVWLAGLLYLLYPVAHYFSVQVLDITLGITLFLSSLVLFLRCRTFYDGRFGLLIVFIAGVIMGLSILVRPNFLPVVPALFVLGGTLHVFSRIVGSRLQIVEILSVCVFVFGCLVPLAFQGFVNWRLSDDFRILPWQGSYNLYAGNHQGANGKFLTQRVSFAEIPEGSNPTRMESEYLYQKEAGPGASMGVGAMNQFWKKRLLSEIAEDPFSWLGLMIRKGLYLVNDWEQYNNLTYAFHKERFVSLKWNPLGWGIIFIGGLGGLYVGRRRLDGAVLWPILAMLIGYAGGLLLFFVSARFRLPLVPLFCVFVGGLIFIDINELKTKCSLALVIVCAGLLFGLSYGNWFDARSRETFIQDELLLAIASSEVGKDEQALYYANAVLERDSGHVGAREVKIASLYNRWLGLLNTPGDKKHLLEELGSLIEEAEQFSPSSAFIAGVYFHNQGFLESAKSHWLGAVEKFGRRADASFVALALVNEEPNLDRNAPLVQSVSRVLSQVDVRN